MDIMHWSICTSIPRGIGSSVGQSGAFISQAVECYLQIVPEHISIFKFNMFPVMLLTAALTCDSMNKTGGNKRLHSSLVLMVASYAPLQKHTNATDYEPYAIICQARFPKPKTSSRAYSWSLLLVQLEPG